MTVPAYIAAMVLMVVGHPVPLTCSTQAEWSADPATTRFAFPIDAYTRWPDANGSAADSIHFGPVVCARHDGIGDLQVLLEAAHARHPYTGADETDDMCTALGWLRYTLRRDPVTEPASMWYEQQAWTYFQGTPESVYRTHPCWPPVGLVSFMREHRR